MSTTPATSKTRKLHRCRLCGQRIEAGDRAVIWSYLDPGNGYRTSHAHPECFKVTIDERWSEDDWEVCMPGDLNRP